MLIWTGARASCSSPAPLCKATRHTPGIAASGAKCISGTDRAANHLSLRGIALPADTHFEARDGSQPGTPVFDARWIDSEVGYRGGDGCKGSAEQQGQTQQRGGHLVSRQWSSPRQQLIDTRTTGQDARQGGLALQQNPAAFFLDQTSIANELKRIAQTLLRLQQDGLAVQGGPIPGGWRTGIG